MWKPFTPGVIVLALSLALATNLARAGSEPSRSAFPLSRQTLFTREAATALRLPNMTLRRMGYQEVPYIVSFNPGMVSGGHTTLLTVTLGGETSSDQLVSLQTDHSEAFTNLPSYIVVPSGQTSASVTVTTSNALTSSVTATVTASANGGSAQGQVLVLTPGMGGW